MTFIESVLYISELWLQWLKDESQLVSDDSEREEVEALFNRAVKDYLCKPLETFLLVCFLHFCFIL